MEDGKKTTWEPINFIFYLSFVKWPILIAIALEVGLRVLIYKFLPDLPADRVDLFMWLIRLIAFVFVGRKIGQKYGEVPPMGAIAGLISGIVLGVIIAFSRFIDGWQVWKFFNIITESVLTAIIGGLAVYLIVYLWDLWPKKLTS